MKNFLRPIFISCCLFLAGMATTRGQATLNSSLPANTTICTASDVSFSVSASGSGTLTYQWQESTDGGLTWDDLVENSFFAGVNPLNGIYTGTTGPVLTIHHTPSTMNGNKYQAIVLQNGAHPVTSVAAVLNVGPDVSLDDATSTNCPTTPHTLNAPPTAGVSYQWQVSSNSGTSWSNVVNGADATGVTYSGGATSALTISSLTTAVNNYKYRYIANDGHGCIITSAATTQIVPTLAVIVMPSVTTVSASVGSSVSIPATLSAGTGPFTYTWSVATAANPTSFGPISTSNVIYTGQTTATLTIPNVTTDIYSNRYRLTVKTVGGCTSQSSAIQVGLPVSLALGVENFKAVSQPGSLVLLSWEVGSGFVIPAYTVQRSSDGLAFADAGVVKNEAGKTTYGFTDVKPATHYRLKMTGPDNTIVYSTVAHVVGDGSDRVELRPSVAAGGTVNLFTAFGRAGAMSVSVTDVMGRVLSVSTVRVEKGEYTTPVDVSRLGKGIYFVRVSNGVVNKTISFVKE